MPLYSRKLHMRVRLARTSWETSLTILALSLGDRVVNHLARRWIFEEVRLVGRRTPWLGTRATPAAGKTHHFALAREED